MNNYDKELLTEKEYLKNVLQTVEKKLQQLYEGLKESKEMLISLRKEMWANEAHSSDDADRMLDSIPFLNEVNSSSESFALKEKKIKLLERQIKFPYFARVDFNEEYSDETEKIYIGRNSLVSDNTQNILVYDWRTPIASIYYRFELGEVYFKAPQCVIRGRVSLKRQYEIKNGELKYFIDSSIQIADDFLRRMLSKNASAKMTAIVETIQKEQDVIIRNLENRLLIIQGVAGSGKTSVALHRVAYLMYEGLSSRIFGGNIIIISPNRLFAEYISNVLPELGEINVQTLSFEDICQRILKDDNIIAQTRNQFFEELITCNDEHKRKLIKFTIDFKTSSVFALMIYRLIAYYERKLIPMIDIYYNGKIILKKEIIKATLLHSRKTSLAERLNRLKNFIIEKIRFERKQRIQKLNDYAYKRTEHVLDWEAFARMISIKENKILIGNINKLTQIEIFNIYKQLFCDTKIFKFVTKGLKLPDNIYEIIKYTNARLDNNVVSYEDALALTLLKAKITENTIKNISQVVVDEIQDYYPVHFELFKNLFPKASYTVFGDINQTIEKSESINFFNEVQKILDIESSLFLTLSKSFRCTNEIIAFSSRFIENINIECFNRKGSAPKIFLRKNIWMADKKLVAHIKEIMNINNYSSACILCKSLKQSKELFLRIKDSIDVEIVEESYKKNLSGVLIIPIYMAKGLEFDFVIVYNADEKNYYSDDDKKLLYIASTRALHKLDFFCEGKPSKFLLEKKVNDLS